MESSIKIDFRDSNNGKGLQPVIAVKLIDSEDSRDKLLKTFFQSLGGSSSWLIVSFDHHIIQDVQSARTFISIHPVTPDELKETVSLINKRLKSTVASPKPVNLNPIKDRYLPADEDSENKLWDDVMSIATGNKFQLDSETLFHLKEHFSVTPRT